MAVLELCRLGAVEAVSLGCEDHWFDKLGAEILFVVLMGGEDEPGKRVQTASTIAGMLSFVKGG